MKRTDFLQKVAVLVLLLGMMININVNAQLIRYVYPGGRGTQTGDKWDNASPDLQAMIDTVETKGGGEVWVAEGTYVPTQVHGDTLWIIRENGICPLCTYDVERYAMWEYNECYPPDSNYLYSFRLKPNVEVYGGFAGNETSLSQRNYATHPTILSGVSASAMSQSNHVVISVGAVGNAALDGFIIEKGNANKGECIGQMEMISAYVKFNTVIMPYPPPPPPQTYPSKTMSCLRGAGIYLLFSSPALRNLTIRYNHADSASGGGLYTDSSDFYMHNCEFYNNTALQGGGMFIDLGMPQLHDVEVHHNTSQHDGGGIYNECNMATFENVNVDTNCSTIDGAGVHNARSYPTWNNCNIYANILSLPYNTSTFCNTAPAVKIAGSGMHDYDCYSTLNSTNIYGNVGGTADYEYEYDCGTICPNLQSFVSPTPPENADFSNNSLQNMQLRTFPNPVSCGEKVNVIISGQAGYYQGEVVLRVFTVEGREIYQQTLSKGEFDFTCPTLSAGIYFMDITTQEGYSYKAKLSVRP